MITHTTYSRASGHKKWHRPTRPVAQQGGAATILIMVHQHRGRVALSNSSGPSPGWCSHFLTLLSLLPHYCSVLISPPYSTFSLSWSRFASYTSIFYIPQIIISSIPLLSIGNVFFFFFSFLFFFCFHFKQIFIYLGIGNHTRLP